VKDTNKALALMAANYFEDPSKDLKLVGITGTNGKTTIASLFVSIVQKAGLRWDCCPR
jgi:UDP-N-acetylmuramoyl-L-alanyl-D-glutamate--2,6-diaminopimelate ligase